MKTSGLIYRTLTSIFIFCVLFVSCDSDEQAENGLLCQEAVFYFGRAVSDNAIYCHVFQIENQSSEVQVISQVRADCGCTSAGASADTVLPWSSVTVPVFFNSIGFNGITQKRVRVYYVTDSYLDLNFQIDCGQFPEILEFTPQQIYKHPDSVLSEVCFTVCNVSEEQVLISCESYFDYFYESVSIDGNVLPSGSETEIRLRAKSNVLISDFRDNSITILAVGNQISETSSISIMNRE